MGTLLTFSETGHTPKTLPGKGCRDSRKFLKHLFLGCEFPGGGVQAQRLPLLQLRQIFWYWWQKLMQQIWMSLFARNYRIKVLLCLVFVFFFPPEFFCLLLFCLNFRSLVESESTGNSNRSGVFFGGKKVNRNSYQSVAFGQGVQVHVVSWALPPNMKYTKDENWCGQRDLIRLHALGPNPVKKRSRRQQQWMLGVEDQHTLQGTNISHHGRRKIIFKTGGYYTTFH